MGPWSFKDGPRWDQMVPGGAHTGLKRCPEGPKWRPKGSKKTLIETRLDLDPPDFGLEMAPKMVSEATLYIPYFLCRRHGRSYPTSWHSKNTFFTL